MKYIFVLLLLLSTVHILNAQQQSYTISGKVLSDDQQPLESATVYLESAKDSTLLNYTITNKHGQFLLQGKTYEQNVNLYVSYVGFEIHLEELQITAEALSLAPIQLRVNTNTLDEIVIKSRAPITIKKDTLEFNVASFKTRKDATVEDLLKELPGVEVGDDGAILVNGKPVSRILVNGKPFFGDDPTIATRNLTKEMIEKVQVVDTKTESEAFAGEDGDQENKTINLTISEEKNKGAFGRLAAGGGTDDRYEAAGLYNFFDNNRRLSFLAGSNNINSPGFSFGEIQKMFGGGQSIMMRSDGSFQIDDMQFGMGEGIMQSYMGGANYVDAYGEKTDITVDYFYSGTNSINEQQRNRENILPETSFFTNTNSASESDSHLHRVNLRFDVKIDSTLLLNIRPVMRYSTMESMRTSDEFSTNAFGEQINQADVVNQNSGTTTNFSNRLEATKKFGTKGSFLRLSVTNEWNTNRQERYLLANTVFFDEETSAISRNQFTDREEDFTSFMTSVTYRIPLIDKKLFFNINYSYREDKRENTESTFDLDSDTGDYSLFNPTLSTDFIFKNIRSTPGIGISASGDKWRFSVGMGYVLRTMQNEDILRPELQLKRNFKAMEYNSYLSYNFSNGGNMYAGYNRTNAPPLLQQIQPFTDVTNPLFIITGNPNLNPTNTHSFYLGLNNFDMQKARNYYVYANFQALEDNVVVKTTVGENLIQNTTYENVSGDFNGYLGLGYRKDIKLDSIHTLRYNISGNTSLNRNKQFFEEQLFTATNIAVGPSLRLSYIWRNVLEVSPSYRIATNRLTFDIDSFERQNYINHNFNLQTATFLPKKWEWRNDINFVYNPNVVSGFQQSAWFWNTTLSYSILNDKALLTLKVFDVLNQNTNAQRTATQNYIQDSQSLVLQRYAMLGFSWKFNNLGKKGETPGGFEFF
jgi:hypothetical protein